MGRPIESQSPQVADVFRGPIAALLAWIVPGLGHVFLREYGRGLIFFFAITLTFWSGVAIGGVRNTIDPHHQGRKLWFVAQMCTGGNALAGYALQRSSAKQAESAGPYLSSEVGVHYTGVAGMLNILVILDSLGRAAGSGSRRPAPVPA